MAMSEGEGIEHVDSYDGKHLPVCDCKVRERMEETGRQ